MKKNIIAVFCLLICVLVSLALAASPAVRLKDIAHILGARDNQLMGFGLVVGLNNSGDKTQSSFTQQAVANLMSRMGVVPQSVDFKSRNVAAVMVTATLPPFVRSGQKLDVTVSSLGDATSLQGGTLLITPLQGVDDQVYAVAQGSVLVGADPSYPSVPYVRPRQVTAGRIPEGALVEKEVSVSLEGSVLTIVLDSPDFTTASRVATAISNSGIGASARDAATITVASEGDPVSLISKIENLTVAPDTVAKIIVNERTGTVVIGEHVVISPVAVSYSGIDVYIGDVSLYSIGNSTDSSDYSAGDQRYQASTNARLSRKESKLKVVPASPTLASLVRALNAIGASPKDLISILQAMKKSGAIKAPLEVI
ncbi:MAG: flagellar basal body P-ring protein FlgI [Candidatus Margulisbacteria bacterium]|nr:flagellar basal body P-ring protein FlgI [Candidatus Margulisiibacteriota bacterium]